ncbi:cupin domain-containing protein [Aliagarivorans taiwanensis]|uniref:cupin domain-containing protein n=1 Tax=Aliagarivorans taiwanensis TaxID=561966 RepID=UPI0003F6339A|nr:hypothetical protein [Aliagarivorans taiwanensis]
MVKHILMRTTEQGSELLEQAVPKSEPIALPQANAEPAPLTGWSSRMVEDMGLSMLKLTITEDAAEFPIHSSDEPWLAYVVCGQGTLYSGSHQQDKGTGIEYQAGDYISFEANTPHGWLNRANYSEILFVKKSK